VKEKKKKKSVIIVQQEQMKSDLGSDSDPFYFGAKK